MFLTALQDEVHRYAISFHRLVHTKNTFISGLEKIKGIGEVKKNRSYKSLRENFLEELDELKLTEKQKQEIAKLYGDE